MKSSQTKAIVVVGSLLIVALVGVIIALVMNLNRSTPPEEELPQRSYVVDDENAQEVMDQITAAPFALPQYYDVRMSTVWDFPDGASPSSNAYVENVTENSNDVYFDVELSDTGEIVYESPVIPLGKHLERIKLDKDLDPGHYDAVVIYHLVDEQQRTLSTVRMAVEINIAG